MFKLDLRFCNNISEGVYKVMDLDDIVLRRSLLGMLGHLTRPLLEEIGRASRGPAGLGR